MRRYLAAGLAGLMALALPGISLAADDEEIYRQLGLFGDVLDRVRTGYVEDVDEAALIEAAIEGMLASLDPHSRFLSPKSFENMQIETRGEFGGLGIEVTMENGLVKVIAPIDETPAQRAGIEAGDLVTHLDGTPVLGLTLGQAVEKMRGPVDSEIRLTVRRSGLDQAFDVTITRAIIKIRSVRARMEGDDVMVVRVSAFSERTVSDLETVVEGLWEERGEAIRGVVLDLRNNPGGLLDQAVAVSDAFLDRGEIVSTRGRRVESIQRFNARQGDIIDGLPLVVLINGGSASGSEIVAGALQDHRRGIVMGTRSFGKGSVQTVIPLDGRGALRLTTSRYYTPSGRSIQVDGIEPDILVEQARPGSVAVDDRRREADLRGRFDNEMSDPNAPAKPDEPVSNGDSAEPDDYQLTRAIDFLRGYSRLAGMMTN